MEDQLENYSCCVCRRYIVARTQWTRATVSENFDWHAAVILSVYVICDDKKCSWM